jgi:hypothetical protein
VKLPLRVREPFEKAVAPPDVDRVAERRRAPLEELFGTRGIELGRAA